MGWTTREVAYLRTHAHEGARAVAEALRKTESACEHKARREGISLRRRWLCPKCGMTTFRPLRKSTGWCACCTKEARAEEIAEQVREMEAEEVRDRRADRERQRLYNRKYNARRRKKSGGKNGD